MKSGQKVLVIFSILIVLILISSVSAITGSIGNGRMVLRASTGDTIDNKYILVKNVNDVDVKIEVFPSGDLEKYTKIIDPANFTLAAGDEKKVYFTIKVEKEGTTETNLNVKFSPVDGKNGVGMSATIVVVAEKTDGWTNSEDTTDTNSTSNIIPNIANSIKKLSLIQISLIITSLLFIIFIILLIFLKKRNKKGSDDIEVRETKPKKRVQKE